MLKTDLFHRGLRGATPTAALRSVLPRMREVDKERRAIAFDLARSDEAAFCGPIRIARFGSAAGVLLPPAVSKFMRRHRDVRVWLSAVREPGADVDSDTAVLAMVAHGSGFAIMPELAVEPLTAAVQKITPVNEFRRHVWFCGRANKYKSRIGRVLSPYIPEAEGQWLIK